MAQMARVEDGGRGGMVRERETDMGQGGSQRANYNKNKVNVK